jgi:hypothetical protein
MPQIGKQSWFAELQRTYTRFLKASIPIEGLDRASAVILKTIDELRAILKEYEKA